MNFAVASRALLEHPIKTIDYWPPCAQLHGRITFNLENGDTVTLTASPNFMHEGEHVAGFHFKVNRRSA